MISLDLFTKNVAALALLFAVVSGLFIHRVPGLMGDEGSEGVNVYELMSSETIIVVGERSYIGPVTDYLRVPFIFLFGYTPLALRLPIWLINIGAFIAAAYVFRKFFGDRQALTITVVTFFSPIFLTYGRLGWAITVLPAIAIFSLAAAVYLKHSRALVIGLILGLGLHVHILFLPLLVGIASVLLVLELVRLKSVKQLIASWWPAVVGFWAAFASQFTVMQLMRDDQGDPTAVASIWLERLTDLPSLIPLILSGSSYIARFTGAELSPTIIWLVTLLLVSLALAGLVLTKHKRAYLLWFVGTSIALVVTLYMVDRFTLRYFFPLVSSFWVLAAVGVSEISGRLSKKKGGLLAPHVVAGLLSLLYIAFVLVPFLNSGGSLNDFSLANRTNSARDVIDTRSLVSCVRGLGPVTTESVHIYNRLDFLQHQYADIELVPESEAKRAQYRIHYRLPQDAVPHEQEACPELRHFIIEMIT